MSDFTDFNLYDGQATPVVHQFKAHTHGDSPISGFNRHVWLDTSVNGGSYAGANKIALDTRVPAALNLSGINKQVRTADRMRVTHLGLYMPQMEVVSGATEAGYTATPSVQYTNTAMVKLMCSENSTDTILRNLMALLSNLLVHTGGDTGQFRDAIIYGNAPR